jgi:murein DD-endopeptidase MepM/ murein hydrolase activator NlpD
MFTTFGLIFTARPNFMKKLDPNQDSGEPQNFQFHFEFAQILGGALGIALVTLALFWGLPHTLIMTQRLKLLGYNVQAQQHHMQSRQIQNYLRDIDQNQNKIFAIHNSEQEIRRTLGMQVEYDNKLLNFTSTQPNKVQVRTAILGDRIEKKEICISNRTLLNFYNDPAKKYISSTSPEALARILESLINNQQTDKKVQVVTLIKNKLYTGIIDNKEVFRLTDKDSVYYSNPVNELAESFANKINTALDQISKQRLQASKPEMFLDLPIEKKLVFKNNTTQEQLHKNLDTVMENLNKTRNRLAGLQRESLQMSQQFAQTPSTVPIEMPISSMYGFRVHPVYKRLIFHAGVDFQAYWGSYVRSTGSGRVVYAGWSKGYGNMVRIYHGWGLSTLYAHNSKLLVQSGQWIEKGRVIARAGATGMAAGAHVHYEVHRWCNQKRGFKKLLNA